jgi:hypothetical protein
MNVFFSVALMHGIESLTVPMEACANFQHSGSTSGANKSSKTVSAADGLKPPTAKGISFYKR